MLIVFARTLCITLAGRPVLESVLLRSKGKILNDIGPFLYKHVWLVSTCFGSMPSTVLFTA